MCRREEVEAILAKPETGEKGQEDVHGSSEDDSECVEDEGEDSSADESEEERTEVGSRACGTASHGASAGDEDGRLHNVCSGAQRRERASVLRPLAHVPRQSPQRNGTILV